MRFKRATISILTISLLAGVSFYFFGIHKIKPISNSKISPKDPSFQDFNFTQYTDNGALKRFTVQGRKIFPESKEIGILTLRTGAQKAVRLSDVRVTFYENNLPVSFIEAKKAVLDTAPDKNNIPGSLMSEIDLFGDISVVTEDRRTLSCNSLLLDSEKNRMSAGGNCAMRYEGKTVKADYINSDIKLRDFSYWNDTKKRFKSLAKIFKTI